MTTMEEHREIIREMEGEIKEKIRTETVPLRQRIIGFATSEGAVNCFALLLHKKNLISQGFSVNHKYFASRKRAEDRFAFDVPERKQLMDKLVRMELLRDHLCYGKKKPEKEAEEAVRLFFDVKAIVEKEIGEPL